MANQSHETGRTQTRSADAGRKPSAARTFGGSGQRGGNDGEASVTETRYPVVRHGRLVRAVSASDPAVARVLTVEQSELALKTLAERKDSTLAEIRKAMQAAMSGRAFSFLETETEALADAGRAKGLGIVYNYHEFAIALDGATIVVRCAVTLCVELAADLQAKAAAENEELPFSKFWTRFILVKHPKSTDQNKLAIDLSDKVLTQFHKDCEMMADAAIAAITPIYTEVLEGAMGGEKLVLDSDTYGRYDVFTVGAAGGDAADVFGAASVGESFAAQVRGGSDAARRLAKLAMPALGHSGDLETALSSFQSDEDCQVVLYDTGSTERGIYLARFEDDVARFVGLSLELPGKSHGETRAISEAHHASSNVVSAGLISMYARRF